MSTRTLAFPPASVGTVEEIHSGRKVAAAGIVTVDAEQPVRLMLERKHDDVLSTLGVDDIQSLYLWGTATLKSSTIALVGRLTGLVELHAPCKGAWDDHACTVLSGLTELRGLSVLRAYGITDTGFRQLAGLTQLRRLRVEQAKITSSALTVLDGMPQLSSLALHYCRAIDDEGLKVIGRQTGLTWLALDGTAVSDRGMPHLAGLCSLQVLFLTSTAGVTSLGLSHLPRNTPPIQLVGFTEARTPLSQAQCADLRQQHPHLDFGGVRELTPEPTTRDLVRERGRPLAGSTITRDAPLLAIFTTDNCIPCDRMLPVVAELGRQWNHRMSTVHIHSPDHPDIAEALEIRSAPSLVLFASKTRTIRLPGSSVLGQLKAELSPYLGLAVH